MAPEPFAIVSRTTGAVSGDVSAGPAEPPVPASASWWQSPHVGTKSAFPRRSNAVSGM
jgi:hypothetical protein